jgi:tRNA(Ile)-lysidine synthase
MPPLTSRLRRFIERERLVAPGDRVVVAFSGGPDSTALLWLLQELLPPLGAAVAGAAHLHHGLRGRAADEDEAFCAEMSRRAGVPFVAERVDAGQLAAEGRCSVESAAHEARRAFLERTRARLGASLVATGHTLDDQAETFLLRAVRGAGRRALGGIRPRRGRLIRPLLETSRAELGAWLGQRGLASREDESNRDLRIPRNRIRHEVLPRLVAEWPGTVGALARAARAAGEDADCLDGLADTAVPSVVSEEASTRALDVPALLALEPAIRRRLVWRVLSEAAGAPVASAHVQRVLDLAASAPRRAGPLALPGQRVVLDGTRLVVEPCGAVAERPGASRGGATPAPAERLPPSVAPSARPSAEGDAASRWHLPVPGTVVVTGGRFEIAARQVTREEFGTVPASEAGRVAALDATVVAGPLFVRTRRPGDRVRPLGAPGTRKLQDVLVDRKVPRAERDAVPLVVDADDRIVWVAGHAVAEAARVVAATTNVLLLELRPAGGSR